MSTTSLPLTYAPAQGGYESLIEATSELIAAAQPILSAQLSTEEEIEDASQHYREATGALLSGFYSDFVVLAKHADDPLLLRAFRHPFNVLVRATSESVLPKKLLENTFQRLAVLAGLALLQYGRFQAFTDFAMTGLPGLESNRNDTRLIDCIKDAVLFPKEVDETSAWLASNDIGQKALGEFGLLLALRLLGEDSRSYKVAPLLVQPESRSGIVQHRLHNPKELADWCQVEVEKLKETLNERFGRTLSADEAFVSPRNPLIRD